VSAREHGALSLMVRKTPLWPGLRMTELQGESEWPARILRSTGNSPDTSRVRAHLLRVLGTYTDGTRVEAAACFLDAWASVVADTNIVWVIQVDSNGVAFFGSASADTYAIEVTARSIRTYRRAKCG